MANRRLRRLTSFRPSSPIVTAPFTRNLSLQDAFSVRKIQGRLRPLFLLLLVTISVALVMILSQTLPRSLATPLSSVSVSGARRWAPPSTSQQESHNPLPSSVPFLPSLDRTDFDKSKVSIQHIFSQDITDHDALTAILPVTTQSLGDLQENLDSLLAFRSSILREIIIVCSPSMITRTERAVKKARAFAHTSVVLTVIQLQSSSSEKQYLNVLHTLSSVLTPRILLLEMTALRGFDLVTRMLLLDTAFSDIPVGPHGLIISPTTVSCVFSPRQPVPVAYLVPPILAPTSLLIQAENGIQTDVNIWAALGERIVKIGGTNFGGVAMNVMSFSQHWCTEAISSIQHPPGSKFLDTFYKIIERQSINGQVSPLHVEILLPDREDMEAFGPTICEMATRGAVLRIMLFSWSGSDSSTIFALDVGCHLHFETVSHRSPMNGLMNGLKEWVQRAEIRNSVLLYASKTLSQTLAIEYGVESFRSAGCPIIGLPIADLPFCEWMSVLGVQEWNNWHRPRIDLSVITNNRPRSLARLLASLTAARYYGDSVQLKVNLEQTADAETRQIVSRFRWDAGALQVQHRVILAGLLPAVIESWYPHGNDSYGVLLEDDVELSPMFFAWVKMTILKYRYGSLHAQARTLFGISLYQPTNLELRVEGRVPFEPRMIFVGHEFPDSRTPYLSQVPCSWGAVYFPEHFVEFHDYLVTRLSQATHDISTVIIPEIRSNRWKKSWKKYFNELVYLRGYVMLYPNYDLSLATNHVEVGAHVKVRATHVHESIKRQFEVPLMSLPAVTASSEDRKTSLLDLPSGSLPSWKDLPVLDLWGFVTSHKEIVFRGQDRHELVSGCPSLKNSAPLRYDASELLCARTITQLRDVHYSLLGDKQSRK